MRQLADLLPLVSYLKVKGEHFWEDRGQAEFNNTQRTTGQSHSEHHPWRWGARKNTRLQKVEVRVPPLMCCHIPITAAWAPAELTVSLLQLVPQLLCGMRKEGGSTWEPYVRGWLVQGGKSVRGWESHLGGLLLQVNYAASCCVLKSNCHGKSSSQLRSLRS